MEGRHDQNVASLGWPDLARRYTGAALWARMSQSFGYLTKAGYGGHVFPLIFGETGSRLQTARPPCFAPMSCCIFVLKHLSGVITRHCAMHGATAAVPKGLPCSCAGCQHWLHTCMSAASANC